MYVYVTGAVQRGEEVNVRTYGMRPALNLNLAALADAKPTANCSYAGTVCSNGIVKEKKANWDTSLSNPRIDDVMSSGQKVTWDCVWFGSYPQAEVVSASGEYTSLDKRLIRSGDLIRDDVLYQKLKSATGWDALGDIVIEGEKYRRIKKADATSSYTLPESGDYYDEAKSFYQWKNETDYHYFKYQPIKWRILAVNDSEAFLLADKALDNKQYHIEYEDVTWEKSTVRSWLNGYDASANKQSKDYSTQNFIDTAFDSSTQVIIKDTIVENKDGFDGASEGGQDTIDKIFLLSAFEAFTETAESYGFISDRGSDEGRMAKSSSYAKAMGTMGSNWEALYDDIDIGNCFWWLRSPAKTNTCAQHVENTGWSVVCMESVDEALGIRPAIKLDLAEASNTNLANLYSYAGKVCSDGTVREMELSGINLSGPHIVKDDSNDIVISSERKVTWDCVWFGSYPQAEVVSAKKEYTSFDKEMLSEEDLIQDDALYQKLKSATGWDDQGDIQIAGGKYRRIKQADIADTSFDSDDEGAFYHWENKTDYHYFKYQPIKWRVLLVNGGEILLLSDKALDAQCYHDDWRDETDEEWDDTKEWDEITWEKSTVRSWLNGYGASANQQNKDYGKRNFADMAFSALALSAIKNSSVENRNNLEYDIDGGKNTIDKIFLLSESEIYTDTARKYGFAYNSSADDKARRAKSSLYAKAMGTLSDTHDEYMGNCEWWGRSPGEEGTNVVNIDFDGQADNHGAFATDGTLGIRPALTLNLSALLGADSSNCWSYAGTVCSDGTVDENSDSFQTFDEDKHDKAVGVNVAYHTIKEIREYAKQSNASSTDVLAFVKYPVVTKPYALGKLSNETLKSATAMLNQVRYIAGIPHTVELSDSYNELAQAATLSNYVNNELSHRPTQPDGMADEMYDLAQAGASSSNLAWASWPDRSLNGTIISSWLEDGDASNIPAVGHRRWILNPAMGKTGFGAVSGINGTYSAIYAFDTSNSIAQEYGVMWPAQNMPVEYFGKNYPWSVSMGYTVDQSKVQVTLTRKKDGKMWSFSKESSDGDFYVNNDGYGQKGCIIFRPDKGIDGYNAGEEFKVEITGLEQGNVSYTVEFFSLTTETTPSASPKPTTNPTIRPDSTGGSTVIFTTSPTPSPSPLPTSTPKATPIPDIMPTATPDVTVEPSVEPEPTVSPSADNTDSVKKLKYGSKVTDNKTKAVYKVTGIGSNKAVEYIKGTQNDKVNVTIPATVKLQGKSFKVTTIAKNAFKNNKKLKNVSIGKNVKKIGNQAFSGCKNLKKVTIGKNVTTIEANAFSKCNDLTLITIPAKVKKIGAKAFYQCKNLRYIMIKTKKLTLSSVGKNAFSGGYHLPRVKTDKKVWRKYSSILLKGGISNKALFIINPVKLVI